LSSVYFDYYLYELHLVLWLKPLSKDEKPLLYWVTQKNSIEFQVQDSLLLLNTVHILLSGIWKGYLKHSELSDFVLSENAEDGIGQSSASAYVLYLYKSYLV